MCTIILLVISHMSLVVTVFFSYIGTITIVTPSSCEYDAIKLQHSSRLLHPTHYLLPHAEEKVGWNNDVTKISSLYTPLLSDLHVDVDWKMLLEHTNKLSMGMNIEEKKKDDNHDEKKSHAECSTSSVQNTNIDTSVPKKKKKKKKKKEGHQSDQNGTRQDQKEEGERDVREEKQQQAQTV